MSEQKILGCLYITTPRAYLSIDHDAVEVHVEDQELRRIPLMGIDGIVVSAARALSGRLIERLAQTGRSMTLLDGRGVFTGRLTGPTAGNVHLRVAQYAASSSPVASLEVARHVVLAKLQNQRRLLVRRARDTEAKSKGLLLAAVAALAEAVGHANGASCLDELRGYEGEGAREYFKALGAMVSVPGRDFTLASRERRPPRGRTNALLSYVYTLATHEAVAAVEAVGMDPQLGFLHALRPGRPSLALDLVEEVRAPLCDRLALRLINRRELSADDFDVLPGGAVFLNDDGRRIVLRAWSERRQETVRHPVLREPTPWGLVSHVQARLLARHLRGELASYPAFLAPE